MWHLQIKVLFCFFEFMFEHKKDQNEDSKLYCYIIIELYLKLCDDDREV